MSKNVNDTADIIRAKAGDAPVSVALILGSGLAHIADAVDGVAVPYADLDGFPHAGVSGHKANLTIGMLEGVRVAVFGGRSHYYESGKGDAMRFPLEVVQALGADTMVATNAAGSLQADMPTGSIMNLTDHINFSGLNPLIGEPTDRRFVPMKDCYDPAIRDAMQQAAQAEEVEMHRGVYAWYSGPSFETVAEIKAIKILGADAVGMSTVPEVILARFLGMKAAAISCITNMAAGMSDEAISHDHTKAMAPIGAAKLEKVLRRWLRDQAN